MHYKKYLIILITCLSFFLLICFNFSYAATLQNSRYWLGLNLSGDAKCNKRIIYIINFQGRFAFQKKQFEQGLFVSGIGYKVLPNLSFWLGYQHNSPHQFNNIGQQNRAWEQMQWDIVTNQIITISSRSRVEERKQASQVQWSTRLRQRITVKFPKAICDKLTPVFYNEIFFNLNSPPWVNTRGIEQNRAFVGVDVLTSKNTFLEIGYLNQYRWSIPNNVVSHILSATLNVRI